MLRGAAFEGEQRLHRDRRRWKLVVLCLLSLGADALQDRTESHCNTRNFLRCLSQSELWLVALPSQPPCQVPRGPTLGKLSKKQQMNFALPKEWSAQTLPAQSVTFKNARFGGGAVACQVDEKDEEDEEDEADVKLGVVLGEAMSPLMLLKQTLHNLITRDDAPGIVHAFIMHRLAKSVTERLAPKAFKVLISAVKMRYDKVPVACMLAQAMPNFRCAHVIAALSAQGVKVPGTNLVISLSPFCKDLEAKKGRIAAVLEPWELAAWKGVTGLQIPMAAQPQHMPVQPDQANILMPVTHATHQPLAMALKVSPANWAAQPVQPQQAAQPVQPQQAVAKFDVYTGKLIAEPVQPQQAEQPVVRTASSGDCTFVIHKATAATPLGIELKTESLGHKFIVKIVAFARKPRCGKWPRGWRHCTDGQWHARQLEG